MKLRNLILAFFWGALNGSLAFGTLFIGYFVGLGALWIAHVAVRR